ncbi:hypothetical protein D3C76_1735090 [compost metagenome]
MGSGQLPIVVLFTSWTRIGSGQLPMATEVPALSAIEPADRTAGAAAENARAPAKTAAAAIFFNM